MKQPEITHEAGATPAATEPAAAAPVVTPEPAPTAPDQSTEAPAE